MSAADSSIHKEAHNTTLGTFPFETIHEETQHRLETLSSPSASEDSDGASSKALAYHADSPKPPIYNYEDDIPAAYNEKNQDEPLLQEITLNDEEQLVGWKQRLRRIKTSWRNTEWNNSMLLQKSWTDAGTKISQSKLRSHPPALKHLLRCSQQLQDPHYHGYYSR